MHDGACAASLLLHRAASSAKTNPWLLMHQQLHQQRQNDAEDHGRIYFELNTGCVHAMAIFPAKFTEGE